MSDTHVPSEPAETTRVENIPDHSICLALVESSLVSARHDTRCVLPAMLQEGETLVDLRCGGLVLLRQQQGHDSAHLDGRNVRVR